MSTETCAPGAATADRAHDVLAVAAPALPGPRPAPATRQAADQHLKAALFSSFAVMCAFELAASRIDDHADAVGAVTRLDARPDGAGPMWSVDVLKELFEDARSELERLAGALASQEPDARSSYRPEAHRLGAAVGRFARAWRQAEVYAARHGLRLDDDAARSASGLERDLGGIYREVGVGPAEAREAAAEGRRGDELLKAALHMSLEAAIECARSARLGLALGEEAHLEPDLQKLVGHLEEIGAALRRGVGAAIARDLGARARETIRTVSALEQELSARPALARRVSSGAARRALAELQRVLAGEGGGLT